jgi:hypothetical protein
MNDTGSGSCPVSDIGIGGVVASGSVCYQRVRFLKFMLPSCFCCLQTVTSDILPAGHYLGLQVP